MLNKKLVTISKYVAKDDIVIDIGCDHAYLAIYLKKNKLCKEVYASDISKNALNIARDNIKKHKTNIKTYLSDGFLNINNKDINTAIISGMGTSTILNIVKNAPNNITKYIISSNNDYELLRKEMVKENFYNIYEIVIEENNKYYPIIVFKRQKDKQKEHKLTLKYGKSNNKEYFKYLEHKEINILKSIPKKHILTRLKHQKNIKDLRKIQNKK